MHYTIIGAGAIGGTVGAYLIKAGHEVLFVEQDTAHVEAINTHGLTIEGREAFTVPAEAISPDELPETFGQRVPEAVFLCVKAMHTEAALAPIVPVLGPESFVVSLQNGLNERVVAEMIGAERTIGAFVNFGADYLKPGRIMYGGTGALYLGELDGSTTPRLRRLAATFRESFLPNTQITDNIWGYLWGKLSYASLLFATAVVDATIADVLAHPAYRPTLANLAAEVVRVAEAGGVDCEGFDGFEPAVFAFKQPRDWAGITASLDRLVEFNRRSLKQKSGVWRDLAVRKRKTEVDEQLGAVVAIAGEHEIETPLNQRLIDLIHDLEAGRRAMAWSNLDVLAELNAQLYPGMSEV